MPKLISLRLKGRRLSHVRCSVVDRFCCDRTFIALLSGLSRKWNYGRSVNWWRQRRWQTRWRLTWRRSIAPSGLISSLCRTLFCLLVFTVRLHVMQRTVLPRPFCPSVSQTRGLSQTKTNLCPHSYTTWNSIYPSFLTRRIVGSVNILGQTDPVEAKTSIFNRCSYNVAP